jgi:hypothetical protein
VTEVKKLTAHHLIDCAFDAELRKVILKCIPEEAGQLLLQITTQPQSRMEIN